MVVCCVFNGIALVERQVDSLCKNQQTGIFLGALIRVFESGEIPMNRGMNGMMSLIRHLVDVFMWSVLDRNDTRYTMAHMHGLATCMPPTARTQESLPKEPCYVVRHWFSGSSRVNLSSGPEDSGSLSL